MTRPLTKLFILLVLVYFFFRTFDDGLEKILVISTLITSYFIYNFITFKKSIKKQEIVKIEKKKEVPKEKKDKGSNLDIYA